MKFSEWPFVAYFLVCVYCTVASKETAEQFLNKYNKEILRDKRNLMRLKFLKYSNWTEDNSQRFGEAAEQFQNNLIYYRNQAKILDISGTDDFTKRQLTFLLNTITPSNPKVLHKLLVKKAHLEKVFAITTIPYDKITPNETIRMDVEQLNNVLGTLNDEKELFYLWESHRNEIGGKIQKLYSEYVELNNIGAREKGYSDAGEFKRSSYEVDDLEGYAEEIWDEMKPFYEELHAYVRFKLKERYPNNVTENQAIPAHLFRSVDVDTWHNLYNLTVPYPDEPSIDVSKNIMENMNAIDMFKTAEDFFVSIGWGKLPSTFWNLSVLVKPTDGTKVFCHGTAWDMMRLVDNNKDLRLILCALPNQAKLLTIHHELGHLYYASKYWDLPYEFREGANPAFHEAVGDTLTLSTQTPEHLHKIGLLRSLINTERTDINFLYKTALETVVFLPYAYILDKWMWNVYNGNIKPEEYNKAWWEMRWKYQGIKSPTDRPDNFMDLATKYHIAGDVPFIRYYFSIFLQFTFHKHGCKAAKFEGHLHKCSIYNSKEAGKAFGNMLALGRSKPWPKVLEGFTGSDRLTAQPILEYFAPLRKWLQKTQQEHGYSVGWKEPKPYRDSENETAYIVGFTVSAIVLVLLIILLVLCMRCRKKEKQDKSTAVYSVENGTPLLGDKHAKDTGEKPRKISNNNGMTVEFIDR